MKYDITLDYTKDALLDEFGRKTVEKRYLRNNETSPQEAFGRAACAFADDREHAQRLYDYASNLWFMFASPLLSNGGTDAGLPISCFLSSVDDTVEDLLDKYHENGYLSIYGGGIGNDFSRVRSKGTAVRRGGVTPGVIPFIKNIDTQMSAYHQGMTRRGSAAVYLDVSHPEIEEFIEIRDHIGGDQKRRCVSEGFHHGVNIPDAFMKAVEEGQNWDLIDPHTKEVTHTVSARELWKTILTTRIETGEPYLHFQDTSNRNLPDSLKEKGLRINGSNLCNEIYLPTDVDRTAVCCLSSVNLAKYKEWKPTAFLFIEDLMRMLDNALTIFCEQAPESMWRAVNSARNERSVGLGAMGFHSLLQAENIPFESDEASSLNKEVFDLIDTGAANASEILGEERGEAPDMLGTGERFAHKTAVAPNATSSIICGNVSPSIEPYNANVFVQATINGSYSFRNKELEKLLEEKKMNSEKVWTSITLNHGSVQHLDFLSDKEKQIFKTAFEIDPSWIVQHAADRQNFIDQGQSVNLFFDPETEVATLHTVHKTAWLLGLKGLYYCRSKSIGKNKKSEDASNQIQCVGCEG